MRCVPQLCVADSAVDSAGAQPGVDVTRTRIVLLVVGGIVAAAALFGLVNAGRAWLAWNSIDRVAFDLADARTALALPEATADGQTVTGGAVDPIGYETILVIGSDERVEGFTANQEGTYADVVLLYLEPDNGEPPILVSLPRNLATGDPCGGQVTTLAQALEGCGDLAGGPEAVALAVESYTGVPVDHFGIITFDALVEVVDALDGVTLCTPHALREADRDLLPEGCSVADGATTLAWIRSRRTQEFVDGEWRFVEGVSDLTRIERQQDLLFALLARLKTMRSPATLAAVVTDLGDAVQLDESFSLGEAIGVAWKLRGVPTGQIRRYTVPVEPFATEDGHLAARPTVPFLELIASG